MRHRCLPVLLFVALVLAACAQQPPPYAYMAAPVQPLPPEILQYPGEPPPEVAPPPQVAQYPYVPAPVPASTVPAEGNPYADEPTYTLDSGDRLRIVVFGQQGLTNTYAVDAGGNVAMPLIGAVPARGLTTQELAKDVAARLRRGFVRDPSVTAEIVSYRPFFILGEVNNPGQYPYVANMTVETAVAIAGGFAPRAEKKRVTVRRTVQGQTLRFDAPVTFEVRPGDTIRIKERWF